MRYYILKDKEVVETKDVLEAARHFASLDRILKQEHVGPYWISTVFLGFDHSFVSGKPVLFESMVFKQDKSVGMDRYETYGEAMEGHRRLVEKYRAKVEKKEQQ